MLCFDKYTIDDFYRKRNSSNSAANIELYTMGTKNTKEHSCRGML